MLDHILYYSILAFIVFGSLLIIRLNSAYHPDLLFNKYIVVRNPKIKSFLISKINPEDHMPSIPEKDQNKLLWLSLIFYILWVLLVTFTFVMLFVIPKIPIEPVVIDFEIEFCVSTLNQILPLYVWYIFAAFVFSFYMSNFVRCNIDLKKHKVLKIIWIIACVFMFALSFVAVGYLIFSILKGTFV